MNVKIGTEAAQFPEKEYINEIFLAVQGVKKAQDTGSGSATLVRGNNFCVG
jgi:hypothetical protein